MMPPGELADTPLGCNSRLNAHVFQRTFLFNSVLLCQHQLLLQRALHRRMLAHAPPVHSERPALIRFFLICVRFHVRIHAVSM